MTGKNKKKELVILDLTEDARWDSFSKKKRIQDAITEAVEKVNLLEDMGYKIDFFKVEPEDVDGKWYYHMTVEGTK